MNKEQKNSLLGYVTGRLVGHESNLSNETLNLLISYSILVNAVNKGAIDVDVYVSTSRQIIEGFKKDPLTMALINEYNQLIS